MKKSEKMDIYDMSIVAKATWQAHSLSNAGSNGSIRTMPRTQLLADGTETDACSGNSAKYQHDALLLEYLANFGVPICSACRVHDGRRAFAVNEKNQTIESIINGCGICDCHGFLIPAKNSSGDENTGKRERISKYSLVKFAMALAIPGTYYETTQLYSRMGEGQMLMKMPSRSGQYAICVRYKAVGVGVDTEKWNMVIHKQEDREKRHQAILLALRDQLLSPDGALTARLLPHLTGFEGVILVKKTPGKAPIYSALEADYRERLEKLSIDDCITFPFENINQFSGHMNRLVHHSTPSLLAFAQKRSKR